MKYIFCSMMFDNVESDIKNSREPNAVSGHKFQENILRGLIQNDADVYVLNTPRIRHYPDYPEKKLSDKEFVFEDIVVGKSIGFNNRFLISYISQYIQLKGNLSKLIKSVGNEQCVLITFNSYLVQSINMIKIRNRFKNVKICDIIGDLHGQFGLLRKNATIKERLVDLYGRFEDRLAKKFDYFVFLSKYMREAIPCEDKQYTVIEGIYNNNISSEISKSNSDNEEKRILLYAGSIDIEYDIEHLIRAFSITTNADFRLFIAGNGNGLKFIKESVRKDSRIRYLGILSPSDLLQYQMDATALISPRRNSHSYVKYSFPSKTMECLALGKPYIAHKLDSVPEEYSKYIQYANETDEGLAEKISEILSMPDAERLKLGGESQDFIAKEKNPKSMCRKIITLCEEH